MEWIKSRMKEPSSYAAVGVAVVGLGVVTDQSWVVIIGIFGGFLGFILKEKGYI